MKVPRKDFEIFKKECLKLQSEWGLLGWELYFKFEPLEQRISQINASLESRKATLSVSSEFRDEVNENRNPQHSAKHEMLHLLLWRLTSRGDDRFTSKEELEDAEHEVIMQLLKIIP